jgi:hypothetical protein
MASTIEQDSFVESCAESVGLTPEETEAVRSRAASYLRAWSLPELSEEELLNEAMLAAHCHVIRDGGNEPIRAAIDEIDRRIRGVSGISETVEVEIPPLNRLGMLCGAEDVDRALATRRERLTHVNKMQTSLSRLPSFRIVAGWFTIIVLLFLIFVFTH